ncbi:MAG TPA: HNH endonuclease signature motif containing protein, partial [Streptosporangiaceae bacterium]|nr:HNH endonuclease signature motif containing protein [Streptosporangiaceae bacterium]
AAGLGRLTDDELIGVLRAARRLASWSAAMELAAVADLAARRGADVTGASNTGASNNEAGTAAKAAGGAEAAVAGPGEAPLAVGAAEAAGAPAATGADADTQTPAGATSATADHISDEIAAALTLTGRAADALLDLALALVRLPATMAALGAGRIDRYKAVVIADEVGSLGGGHAAAVERQVLAHADRHTTGQLRAATRQAVLAADPAAARERKQRAEREARVERWDEHAGTAALAGRDLPPAEVLAADYNLSALARSLRRAGAGGTMDQLRAKVYLALLTGQSIAELLSPSAASAGAGSHEPGGGAYPPGGGAYPPGGAGPGPFAGGSVNLTMPLATWLGMSGTPGRAAGYGPLDAGDSRGMASFLAGQPGVRWCLTLTGEHGRAVAHGCARAGPGGSNRSDRAGPGGSSRSSRAGPGGSNRSSRAGSGDSSRSSRASPGGGADPPRPRDIADWLAGISIGKLEADPCSHFRESAGYRPSPSLRHLIMIRQAACSFPGCRRPAGRCDYDHTVPHDRGGRTCECNLAPLCRRHHRAKQADGWSLVQREPGSMTWTTPSGRSYATGPTGYAG